MCPPFLSRVRAVSSLWNHQTSATRMPMVMAGAWSSFSSASCWVFTSAVAGLVVCMTITSSFSVFWCWESWRSSTRCRRFPAHLQLELLTLFQMAIAVCLASFCLDSISSASFPKISAATVLVPYFWNSACPWHPVLL